MEAAPGLSNPLAGGFLYPGLMAIELPEGLISIEELGILSEYDDLVLDERQSALADLIIRATGVMVRFAAGKPEWTAADVPLEAKVVALNFARRVMNNPQNQQRITTGPLGESYSTEELTGIMLTDREEALLATFADSGEGGLSIISVVRSDELVGGTNYELAQLMGLGLNDELIRMPSLSKYLGLS